MKRKDSADIARAETVFGKMLTDPDSIRGGTALAMMLEIIRAHRDNRPAEPGAIVYWGTMFDTWIMDGERRTLDELLELDGTRGRPSIRVEFKRDWRNMLYMENMGLLVGGGFTVKEAAALIVEHGVGSAFKGLNQEALFQPRALEDLFGEYGGVQWARDAGFFSDDPAIKARRDEALRSIPNNLLPPRLR